MKNPRDFWTGVIYVAVGTAAVVIARDYGLGTAFRMGPGYFPTILGGLLVLIGLLSLGRAALRSGEPLPPDRSAARPRDRSPIRTSRPPRIVGK